MSVVPVNIRPHLIPFFFLEFEGKEASYCGKTVTAVKISTSSSLGKMIRLFMLKVEKPAKVDHYNLFLSVADNPEGGKQYEGNYFKYVSGANSFLELPADVNREINNLLEDIFRLSFIFFVDGFMHNGKPNITKGIDFFIDKYDLLEFGFCNEKLRQLYYRERSKDRRLSRMQMRPANRVTNFA
ncbi:hypothetical protein ACX0HA_08910 [Flavobacterium hauense]